MRGMNKRFNNIMTNNLRVADLLRVPGNALFEDAITCLNDVTVNGDVIVNNEMIVGGASVYNDDLLVRGELEVLDDTVIVGDFEVTGTIGGNYEGNILEDSKLVDGLTYSVVEEEVTPLGASEVTTFDIPGGAYIYSVQLINKKEIADDDGNGTYTAAFSGGSVEDINGGVAIAKDMNTKVSELFQDVITTGTTNITFVPNGTNFTAGMIRARVVYAVPDPLPDYVDISDMTVVYPAIDATVDFDAEITGAVDFWGDPLDGAIAVTVTSDVDGGVYSASPVFVAGETTLIDVNLTTPGAHELTVAVVGVTADDVQNVEAAV